MRLLLKAKRDDVELLMSLLAEHGIHSETKAHPDDTVAIRVAPEDYSQAEKHLEAMRRLLTPMAGPWTCPRCQETREEQFSTCWKCGGRRHEAEEG